MGLLDDAIREHLDLKRRRGADPAEIERAEREALGPARRSPEPEDGMTLTHDESAAVAVPDGWDVAPSTGAATVESAWPPPDSELAPAPEHAGSLEDDESLDDDEHEVERSFDDDFEDDEFADDDYEEEDEFDLDSSAASVSEYTSPAADPPAASNPPPVAATPPNESARPPEPPRLSDNLLGETVEYDVEEAFADPARAEDDDVLEETPEFLQDTPDHDRLWFEQRPPRDFDFDG